MSRYEGPLFDADHHYYEAHDAFLRHVPERMRNRCVQWVQLENGHKRQVVRGKIDYQVPNPTFDPISKPGTLRTYYKGNPEGKTFMDLLRSNLEPLPAAYQDRDARLGQMDEQGVEAAWFFPTAGIHYEEPLRHDIEAVTVAHRGFNRWLEEDWGFAYRNRIFAAPYMTLADPAAAVEELDWAIDRGARLVVMRPAPVTTADGPRSPGAADFDGFWARVAEAGIVVVAHAGNSGYGTNGYPAGSGSVEALGGGARPSVAVYKLERAILDWLTALCFDRVFERFPGVRVASVENGAVYLHDLFRMLRSTRDRYPRWFQEDPAESFKQHVWINPFWEDRIDDVVEFMGVDRVIFGSDFPHMEGLEYPAQVLDEISHLSEADQRRIVHDNASELTGVTVAA
ncbi:MAG TPA: amidohydrolase family protein [Mycobacterium sp.]|nr:amidohydrolase family protein [Mycobacterium sp.]